MPDEVPHLRTSERRAFKKCPQSWEWAYRDGLVLRRVFPGARWFGTGLHLALAERYKYPGLRRGRDVLKVWRDFVGDEMAVMRNRQNDEIAPDDEWISARELGEAMLGGYLDRYGKDERWHVVSTEQTFQILIPHPQDPHGEYLPLVEYNGTFDGVRRDLENEGDLWLWENKSAAQLRTGHLAMDDQGGSYWAVAPEWMTAQGIKFRGRFQGIMYDFLRKAKPADEDKLDSDGVKRNKPTKQHYIDALLNAKPGLDPRILATVKLTGLEVKAAEYNIIVMGDVSKVQPTPLFLREQVWRTRAERRTQLRRIQDEALWMQAAREGLLPIIKNPSMDCSWCDFKNMCELHEQGHDWEEFRDAAFTVQDPYADHRPIVGD